MESKHAAPAKLSRRALLLGGGSLLAVGGAGFFLATREDDEPQAVVPTQAPASRRPILGLAGPGFYDLDPYRAFADATGITPEVALVSFGDVDEPWNGTRMAAFVDAGYVPQLTWGPNRAKLADVASGTWDEQIAETARFSLGTGVQVRFGHEMNGSPTWSEWGQQPELYIRAWRRARQIWRDEGNGAPWIWSPNITDPDDPMTDLELYYPGDDECDYVGLDGYSYPNGGNKSFSALFSEDLSRLADLSDRPLWICETAVSQSTPDRAGWISGMFETLRDNPRVVALSWWERDEYAITEDAAACEAFRAGYTRWAETLS